MIAQGDALGSWPQQEDRALKGRNKRLIQIKMLISDLLPLCRPYRACVVGWPLVPRALPWGSQGVALGFLVWPLRGLAGNHGLNAEDPVRLESLLTSGGRLLAKTRL